MAATGTKLKDILTGIRDRIVSEGVFNSASCKIALRMNVPMHTQAQYAIVLPLMQTFSQDNALGQGRYSPIVRGRVNVYVRHRDARDQQYYDDLFLCDTNGLLDKLAQVEDALDQWNPSESAMGISGGSASIAALAEPMRCYFNNEPRKDYASPDWGEGMVELEVAYRSWRNN